jgi:hypothetical protein
MGCVQVLAWPRLHCAKHGVLKGMDKLYRNDGNCLPLHWTVNITICIRKLITEES